MHGKAWEQRGKKSGGSDVEEPHADSIMMGMKRREGELCQAGCPKSLEMND